MLFLHRTILISVTLVDETVFYVCITARYATADVDCFSELVGRKRTETRPEESLTELWLRWLESRWRAFRPLFIFGPTSVSRKEGGGGGVPGANGARHRFSRWFHGNISRAEAESRLHRAKEGSFLVRMCEKNKEEYALSLKYAFPPFFSAEEFRSKIMIRRIMQILAVHSGFYSIS